MASDQLSGADPATASKLRHDDGKATPRDRLRWLVLVFVSLTYLLVFAQRTGPGLVTNKLQVEFHVSAAVLGMMTSVQYLLYMLLQVPVGLFGDRFGPERLFAAGAVLDGAGTVIFSQAHTFPVLLIGRAIVGLGDAFIWVNIVLILGKRFAAAQFGGLLAVVGTAGNIGAVLTTLPFAAWLAVAGWRSPFLTLGIMLALVGVANYFLLAGKYGAGKGRPPGTVRSSGIAVRKVPVRRALRDVVKSRVAWACFCCHFGIVGTYMGFVSIWSVPYFIAVYHLTQAGASAFSLAAFVGAICGGPVIGAVSDRLRERRRPYIVLQSITFLAWGVLFVSFGRAPEAISYLCMFVIGFGIGGSLLTFAYIRDIIPMAQSGVMSGFANTGGFFSAVLLPVLFGVVVDSAAGKLPSGVPAPLHALATGLVVPLAFSLVGVIGSIWMVEHRSSRMEEVA